VVEYRESASGEVLGERERERQRNRDRERVDRERVE
jgi:hypothetical protein